jgi:hypothetical protein
MGKFALFIRINFYCRYGLYTTKNRTFTVCHQLLEINTRMNHRMWMVKLLQFSYFLVQEYLGYIISTWCILSPKPHTKNFKLHKYWIILQHKQPLFKTISGHWVPVCTGTQWIMYPSACTEVWVQKCVLKNAEMVDL